MFILLFDFDRFSKIAANVYDENNPYSLEDCLFVFKCYFEKGGYSVISVTKGDKREAVVALKELYRGAVGD